jgi:rare lipoprotein A
MASYYADKFHGRKTANGEIFDMHNLTAAHRTLPFNTRLRVRNIENDKTVVVRINDRGPFKDNRVIDLSLEAARRIDLIPSGTARVELEIIELGPTAN